MKELKEKKIYTSSELERELHIADDAEVLIYDFENILETVTFGKNASLKYFWYFSEEKSFTKTFLVNGEGSRCEVYSLLSSVGEKVQVKMHGKLCSDKAFLDMYIVSFVADNGVIDLDGIVDIPSGVAQVEWYLKEENIFLGSTGRVRGIPTLLVHSNDVKASHGCNMERISDEKLFYLRSRWLPKDDATILMLESYIRKTFHELGRVDDELCRSIHKEILEKIK